jgi:hypothetical protein
MVFILDILVAQPSHGTGFWVPRRELEAPLQALGDRAKARRQTLSVTRHDEAKAPPLSLYFL